MHANVTSLLLEASYLMAVGMFVVFLFLSILIGAMTLMAWLNKKFPESNTHQLTMPQQGAQSQQEMSTGLIAAITAAVHQHRNK
jgi:oxaloacetate decarboxylase gamma subunit